MKKTYKLKVSKYSSKSHGPTETSPGISKVVFSVRFVLKIELKVLQKVVVLFYFSVKVEWVELMRH